MDYLKEIEAIILYLEEHLPSAAEQLKDRYYHSFTSSELLMSCVNFLLQIHPGVNLETKTKILELRDFCNSIGLFPGQSIRI